MTEPPRPNPYPDPSWDPGEAGAPPVWDPSSRGWNQAADGGRPDQYITHEPVTDPPMAPRRDALDPIEEIDADPAESGPAIERFRYRPRRGLMFVVIVLTAALVCGALWWQSQHSPEDEGTPTPSVSTVGPPPTVATPGSQLSSLPFNTAGLEGTFTITDAVLLNDILFVHVTITLDKGTLSPRFSALDVPTADEVPWRPDSGSEELDTSLMQAGETRSGGLRFYPAKGSTQIFLYNGNTALALLQVDP